MEIFISSQASLVLSGEEDVGQGDDGRTDGHEQYQDDELDCGVDALLHDWFSWVASVAEESSISCCYLIKIQALQMRRPFCLLIHL